MTMHEVYMRNFFDALIALLLIAIFCIGYVYHGFSVTDAFVTVGLFFVYKAYFVKVESK